LQPADNLLPSAPAAINAILKGAKVPADATDRQQDGPSVVALRQIRKSFGPLEVLKGVSLAAREGDVIALIGASGSGKSTLLRCVNLLEVPTAGNVWIAGEEIRLAGEGARRHVADHRQLQRVRSRLGMVFQSFNLWAHLTVLENLTLAPLHVLHRPRAEAVAMAEELLRKVGLYDKRHSYPATLSGGQQQRAAIARALAINPALMLFDEPTSALDPELVGEVLRVIRALAEEGRTMILVTHEMRFAREVASHIVFLHNGRIEEEGPPEQVFGEPVSERCRQFVGAFGPR
jgi:octopine/nopaline transport system ATP-binding protein